MEFDYQGVDKTGKKVTGRIEASNEGEMRVLLRSQGVRPTRISTPGNLSQEIGKVLRRSKRTMSLETLVAITRQLHALITSGIPLVQGLEFLADQASTKNIQAIISNIKDKVAQGSYLWEALGLYPKTFPKIYIALIRVGESSGSLDIMFKRLSRYLENSNRLRKIVKSAMMYPVIVLFVGILVIALMLVFVIPKFEDLLKSNNQELPGPTKAVLAVSHFFAHHAPIILFGIIGFSYLVSLYSKTREGRIFIDRMIFKSPIFGELIQKSSVARFARTMQIMITSGINMIDAIDICKTTMDNYVLEDAIATVRKEVESGKTLGTVIGRLQVFPKMAVQMISVGEASGSLDKMLEKIADFYEEEVEIFVSGMTKLIEPIILVFLGSVVGGLLIAMYLPIFQISQIVK